MNKLMRILKIALSCIFLTTNISQGQISENSSSVEPRSELSAPIIKMLPSASGPVRAVIRQQDVGIIHRPAGTDIEKHTALIVVVPSKRMYWLGRSSEPQLFDKTSIERKFFIIDNKIVGVAPNRGDILNFYISDDPVASDNDDRAARLALRKRYNESMHRWFDITAKTLRMEDILGQFPFTRRPDPRGEPAPQITNIAVNKDNAFTITFRGGKDDKVEAVITFDESFKPLSATLNGKQVYPKPQNQ